VALCIYFILTPSKILAAASKDGSSALIILGPYILQGVRVSLNGASHKCCLSSFLGWQNISNN